MFTMMEELKYRIKEHEGFRDTVYQDHLGNATVGWGHLVTSDDNFQVGITYPEEVLEAVFEKDFKRAREGADQLCKDIPVNYIVRGVIVEMCFQLGKTGVSKFNNMFEALKVEDYQKASEEMLDSKWHEQTPARAKLLGRHGLDTLSTPRGAGGARADRIDWWWLKPVGVSLSPVGGVACPLRKQEQRSSKTGKKANA
jgi:lysozyme